MSAIFELVSSWDPLSVATFGLAFVTAILAVATVWLGSSTRAMVETARESVRIDSEERRLRRAPRIEILGGRWPRGSLQLDIRNVGEGTAPSVSVRVYVRPADQSGPAPVPDDDTFSFSGGAGVVPAGGEVRRVLCIPARKPPDNGDAVFLGVRVDAYDTLSNLHQVAIWGFSEVGKPWSIDPRDMLEDASSAPSSAPV